MSRFAFHQDKRKGYVSATGITPCTAPGDIGPSPVELEMFGPVADVGVIATLIWMSGYMAACGR